MFGEDEELVPHTETQLMSPEQETTRSCFNMFKLFKIGDCQFLLLLMTEVDT